MPNLIYVRMKEIEDLALEQSRKMVELRSLLASCRLPEWPEELPAERYTGWEFRRGKDGQGGSYVRNPKGTDRLPEGYDTTTHPPPPDVTFENGKPVFRDEAGLRTRMEAQADDVVAQIEPEKVLGEAGE